MACPTDGGGCRVCPATWIAGALLLFMLAQSLVHQFTSEPAASKSAPSAQQVHESGEGARE